MRTQSIKIPIGNHSAVVDLERDSIRVFMQEVAEAGYFSGKEVLDFGCGRQPYRELIERAGGSYTGHDPNPEYGHDRRINADADVVVINQVLQYLEDPAHWLKLMRIALREGGILVMTYGTNWREIEPTDLQRYTQAGMTRLLEKIGYEVLEHTRRAEVEIGAVTFALGYGVIARSKLIWRDNEAPREEGDPFVGELVPEAEQIPAGEQHKQWPPAKKGFDYGKGRDQFMNASIAPRVQDLPCEADCGTVNGITWNGSYCGHMFEQHEQWPPDEATFSKVNEKFRKVQFERQAMLDARAPALEAAAWAMPETTDEERSAKRAALHNVGIDHLGTIFIADEKKADPDGV